jgi:hypothetical protein
MDELRQKRSEAAKKGWTTRRNNAEKTIPRVSLSNAKKKLGLKTNIVEFKPYSGGGHLSEIYSSGMQYCLVTKGWQGCHRFAYCKDFLHDAIWSIVNGKPMKQYGFSFSSDNPKPNMDSLAIAVRNSQDQEFSSKWANSIKMINEIENVLGFKPTALFIDKGEKIAFFVADKAWMLAPQTISMYTLLIRAGMKYEGNGWRTFLENPVDYQRNDASYIDDARKGMLLLIENGFEHCFSGTMEDNYTKIVTLPGGYHELSYVVHELSGIVGFSTQSLDVLVKTHPYIKTNG